MRHLLFVAAALMLLSSAASAQVAEKLDRGLVAMRQADGSLLRGLASAGVGPGRRGVSRLSPDGPGGRCPPTDGRARAREHQLRRCGGADRGQPALLRPPRDGRRRRPAQPRGRARRHAGRRIAHRHPTARRLPHAQGGGRRPGRRRPIRTDHPAARLQHGPVSVARLLEEEPGHLQARSLLARRPVPLAARHGLVHRGGHVVRAVRRVRPGRRRQSRSLLQGWRRRPARTGGPRQDRAGMAVQAGRADGANRQEDPLDSAAAGDRRIQLLLPQHAGRRLSGRQAAASADAARDLPGHRDRGVRPGPESRVAMELARREGEIRQPGRSHDSRGRRRRRWL